MSNPHTAGYHQLPDGLWVKDSDNSGPYVFDGTSMTLQATGSGGGGGGGAVTVADGADATQGAIADAAVVAGATGTLSAKLRAISRDVGAFLTSFIKTTSVGTKSKLQITRPANVTPYSAGDVIGGTGSGVSGAVLTFLLGNANQHVMLTSIDLAHEVAAVPAGMTSFRLYLYNATPASALADNAAWDLAAGDLANFIGYVDFGVINDLGSNLFVQVDNVLKHVVLDANGQVYGYLVTNGAWTPGANSTVFDVTLRAAGV